LRRVGVAVDADDDSVTIRPANEAPHNRGAPVVFKTYDDHRMAMALSLVCLRTRGCAIAEPACVAKTYPTYFADLATLYEAAVLAAVDRD
jgi:3-phosphoshikimate 1-carboxyvinyltransferase